MVAPFDEAVGPEPLFEGVPEGWTRGPRARAARATSSRISTDDEYSVWVSDGGAPCAQAPRPPAARSALSAGSGMSGSMARGALSADETIVVLEVMEDGDVLHPSLRALDVATGGPSRSCATRAARWPGVGVLAGPG